MKFSSDVVFTDASGQVRSTNGDLTLRPDDSGQNDVIVGSGRALRPEQDRVTDLGLDYLRWRMLYADGGDFASRPTVNGSGIQLQAEDQPLGYACYVVNENIDFVTFTGTFTPVRWNEVSYEDEDVVYFSRTVNNERIHFLASGVYKVTYSVVAQKETSGAGTSEWEVELNNSGTTIRAGRGYIYHRNSTNDNIATTTKTFIRAFSANDFIEVQGARIAGGGAVGVSDGTSIVLELLRLL
jgi:hypothetical protein